MYVANAGKLVEPEEGTYNQLWTSCTNKSKIQNGQLYESVGVLSCKHDKTSMDEKLAEELWEWTEKLEGYCFFCLFIGLLDLIEGL